MTRAGRMGGKNLNFEVTSFMDDPFTLMTSLRGGGRYSILGAQFITKAQTLDA